MAAVSFAHFRAVLMKPIPGNHSGRRRNKGKKSTKKAPGTVAALKFAFAPSIRLTKGSSPSCTSIPYVSDKMMPPANLFDDSIRMKKARHWIVISRTCEDAP